MIDKAIQWIKSNTLPNGGVIVHSRKRICYPEVTGYFIPTLLSVGERTLARQYADHLCSIQQPNGSFLDPDGKAPYAFDTGQVIRGWNALLPTTPALEQPLRRACDWLISSADPQTGRLLTPDGAAWSLGDRGSVSEAIHLYALHPLTRAGELIGETKYQTFARKSLAYYLKHIPLCDFTASNALTHFYTYIQEALLELGCDDIAVRGMAAVAEFQQDNGAVPAYSNVPWVCSTGLAQLAQVWYRLGEIDRADQAMQFLTTIQNPSGGFFGSYGVGSTYFPSEEISWAAKYTIEACQRQISAHFDRTVHIYDKNIAISDGRVRAVINKLGNLNGKRILDAGCGKGRYSTILKKLYPTADITAMDISAEMLKHIPDDIKKTQAGILDMPFEDNSFDAVICIEALEHVVSIDQGIQQLARVTAFGGTSLIIDKNIDKLGALQMPSWEKWFSREALTLAMVRAGLIVESEFISYNGASAPDGLFICWTGTKAPRTCRIKDKKTNHRQKIAYYGNCWMTNVGEAFIDIGAMEVLKQALPESDVIFVTPMSRYYNNAMRARSNSSATQAQSYQSAAHLGKYINADVFVMSGMFATEEFLQTGSATYWVDDFLKCHPEMKVLFMGIGAGLYSEREVSVFLDYIKHNINLAGFISRDNTTYTMYSKHLPKCHPGIDCAFFVNDIYNPVGFAAKDYAVSTFKHMPEPAFIRSLSCDVIRPEHMFYSARYNEAADNIFISDAPHDYLSLYANAAVVHTDLVHATIVSLSYGTKVKYYHDSQRASAFEAVGAIKDSEGYLFLPRETLRERKQAFVKAVRELLLTETEFRVS